jgi:hypothetical protein
MYSHRQLTKIMAAWLLKSQSIDLVCWEMAYNTGIVDCIGISSKISTRKTKIIAVEVKRTRADLLQDLRKQKMLKYEPNSTHCILAISHKVFKSNDKKDIKTELKELGLPNSWGIVILPSNRYFEPYMIKRPKTLGQATSQGIHKLTRQIARSFCNKSLRNPTC